MNPTMDLETWCKKHNKTILSLWDYEENYPKTPKDIGYGTDKKYAWKCPVCGGKWIATPNHLSANKTNGNGCPYCAHKIPLKGVNDLATLFPNVAKKWHPTLNSKSPNEYLPNSNKSVWWVCDKDSRHVFQAPIIQMIKPNATCPICSNHRIIKGLNDLFTTNPELKTEWDFEKNTNVSPYSLSFGSSKKVWWKCKNGHSWCTSIGSRAGTQKTGCPICSQPKKISRPEKTISYYLSKFFEVEENKRFEKGLELDIYIPKLNLGIEYDGSNWHKNPLRDKKKDSFFQRINIDIIHVREEGCPPYDSPSNKIWVPKAYIDDHNFAIKYAIEKIVNNINEKTHMNLIPDVNVLRDYSDIIKKIKTIKYEKSVANSPLLKEWNYEKNIGIDPKNISLGSSDKFWWKCSNGHEWQASVYSRKLSKCPFCFGSQVIKGENDLKTLYPHIAKEWNYEKNNDIIPENFKPMSNKKVWWKCQVCGHEWETAISNRVEGKNCPQCGRKITIQSHFRKVKCIETGEIFENAIEAGKHHNVNAESIRRCCRHQAKTAKGLHWEYN